jgi:cysteine desulfurase
MSVALKKNCEEIDANKKHLMMLENVLLGALKTSEIDFIRNGARERIPGNVSLSFKGCDGEALLHLLDLNGICVSTGSACDSKNTQVSHVLKAIALDEEYAKGTIRISLGKNNCVDEIRKIADSLIESVGKMNLYDYSGVF